MQVFSPDRRSLLRTFRRLAEGAAAIGFMQAAIWPPGAVLLKAGRVFAAPKEPLIQPPEISSENGVLSTTLTAAPRRVQLGDFSFDGFLYNEKYNPPLLRVRLGDSLCIVFRNDLPDDPSNLHFHGMSVSPQGNSDNVFVHVHPGEQFQYEVHIPTTGRQGPGLFWYHPHAHGFVDKQILGGMSGGLVVDGSDPPYPIVGDLEERFFFIKHIEIGTDSELISINGQINPAVQIRPGEMQFWRIGHIGATLFIKFCIEGMPLYVVARDGHPLTQPQKVSEFFVGPGERIEAIAVGPEPGEYPIMTIPFQDQAWRRPFPAQQLATVISSGSKGSRVDEAEILRQRAQGNASIDEVRAAPIAHRRVLTYSRTPDRKVFMIDGRVMEEDRVDQVVHVGDTEEWTIVNTDQQYHSFHIHQTAFLVTEVNGVSQKELSLRDTFSLPPDTDSGPGVVKVVIPFTDPVIVGRFVYHCHAVDHEDKGMMGVIEVVG
jgi:FtsP/CotA-like multicopper oxidase with cupredoxin domain